MRFHSGRITLPASVMNLPPFIASRWQTIFLGDLNFASARPEDQHALLSHFPAVFQLNPPCPPYPTASSGCAWTPVSALGVTDEPRQGSGSAQHT